MAARSSHDLACWRRASALINLVNSFNLPKGLQTSLDAKLQDALSTLAEGDTSTACADLTGFISQVKAQSGKKLAVAQATQLIAAAQQIQAALGCQPTWRRIRARRPGGNGLVMWRWGRGEAMPCYEPLPIYKKAMDRPISGEKMVRNGGRPHQYTLGSDLWEQRRERVTLILRTHVRLSDVCRALAPQ
jgi:hypothetical protein